MPKNKWLQELDEIDNEDMPGGPDENDLSVEEGFWDRDKKLLLYGAGGGFVLGLLFFLIITFLSGPTNKNSEVQESTGLNNELAKLEKRLADLGKGQAAMQESMSRLFKSTRALEKSFGELDSTLAELEGQASGPSEKDLPSGSEKDTAGENKPEAEQDDQEKQLHVVKKGENLYRISLEYAISISKLRSLNELGPEEAIYPGQELVVGRAEE